ncbi:hypothetical protein C8J23_101177 [Shewanella chilikensis]|uniref:Uncharacterized protein n=1 Tax=Shewanella chilikensis TaxID=558541 RepID=A0ABX5PTE0_9GAMM|nr:hypothetical protein [Shewanella chilikensis]MCL1154799.1 hypothetical protein [Shewanella chilikensis]PYE61135.1 hypothetical protein C8J23_101177 [Shewanella chilikensis]GGZ31693.1 hypothetical protein GCM10007105_19010 [Shewanella chilikensis]
MQHNHDAQHEALMNMKQLRLELRAWANWWLRHEYGKGYAHCSTCAKLKELRIHMVSVIEMHIKPPPNVIRYDRKVEKLSTDCRRAIRAQYFCRGNWALVGFDNCKTFLFWLRRAELQLICN